MKIKRKIIDMPQLTKLLFTIILGAICPVSGFLIMCCCAFFILPEPYIAPAALFGLLCGILVDVFYLKRWVSNLYTLDMRVVMAIYFFYSVMMLGFFMGVPIFNILLAIPAGIYMGSRLSQTLVAPEEFGLLTRRTCIYTTAVLLLVCTTSGAIALIDPFTLDFMQTLLPVSFAIRQWMLASAIVIGGLLLLSLHWLITGWVIRKTVTSLQLKNV
ncbi:MAG TPA: hypothetical protein PLP19_03230 [bacterium]|nr:hypothetical protein [bacterium]HPN42481.1 hypothetical protein [bacterium]